MLLLLVLSLSLSLSAYTTRRTIFISKLVVIFPIVRDSFSDENSVSYTNKYNWDMLSIGLTTDQRENVVVVVFFPAAATNSAHQCRSSFSVFPFDPLFFARRGGMAARHFYDRRRVTWTASIFPPLVSLFLSATRLFHPASRHALHTYIVISPPKLDVTPEKPTILIFFYKEEDEE